MDKGKKTPTKRFKPLLEEKLTDNFGNSLQQHCNYLDITTKIVCLFLSSEIQPGHQWHTYNQDDTECLEDKIIIYIAYENYYRSGSIIKVFIKQQDIPENFFGALFATFLDYVLITTFKLEYCNLTSEDLEQITHILIEFRNIIDVSVDGNPIESQNYFHLLKNTNVQYLSLQRCQINEIGTKLLHDRLIHNNVLTSLNLTGNYIDDDAVKYLGLILRENRKLKILILADNWITDIGCGYIMEPLKKFTLTHEDIVKKRKLKFDYLYTSCTLKEKYKEYLKLKSEIKKEDFGNIIGKISQKSKENVKSTETMASIEKLLTENNINENSLSFEDDLSSYIASHLIKIEHPYLTDVYNIGEDIFCLGNLEMSFINLSYNKIDTDGYKCIIDVLHYQILSESNKNGLIYIILDGNLNTWTEFYKEIFHILIEKNLKFETSNSKISVLNKTSLSKSVVN